MIKSVTDRQTVRQTDRQTDRQASCLGVFGLFLDISGPNFVIYRPKLDLFRPGDLFGLGRDKIGTYSDPKMDLAGPIVYLMRTKF